MCETFIRERLLLSPKIFAMTALSLETVPLHGHLNTRVECRYYLFSMELRSQFTHAEKCLACRIVYHNPRWPLTHWRFTNRWRVLSWA